MIIIVAMGCLIDLSLWSYFSFEPVLHDWCNKGCGVCYPVCGNREEKVSEPCVCYRTQTFDLIPASAPRLV